MLLQLHPSIWMHMPGENPDKNIATSDQIIIQFKQHCQIQVGALGRFDFKAGYYVYSGSAKRNLKARLSRHCRKHKPLRWHIDYLTSHPVSEVIDTQTFHSDECQLNQACPGTIPIPGFGASDCRSGCGAQLKYLGNKQP